MKKVSVLFVCLFVAVASFAQFGVEVGFAPFNDGAVFGIDGLKVRYFMSEKMAIRGTLEFSMSPSTDYTYSTTADNKEIETKEKSALTTFGLTPGFEYHFVTAEKYSVYAGAEVGFGITSASYAESNDYDKEKTEIKGANDPSATATPAGTNLKLGIFTGIDYYITKNLYLGAELGLGYNSFTSKKEITVKYTDPTGTSQENTYKGHNKTSSLGFQAVPSFRLGWTF